MVRQRGSSNLTRRTGWLGGLRVDRNRPQGRAVGVNDSLAGCDAEIQARFAHGESLARFQVQRFEGSIGEPGVSNHIVSEKIEDPLSPCVPGRVIKVETFPGDELLRVSFGCIHRPYLVMVA